MNRRKPALRQGPNEESSASSAFRAHIVACLPRLRAFARVLTRNAEQADDLVQDTVVRALRAENQFHTGTNLGAWLLTILRNQHISNVRRHKNAPVPIDQLGDPFFSTEPEQFATVELQELRRAMMRLSVEHREVLILVGAAGMNYEEAAAICKCAVGTIKSRASRARHELRELLAERRFETRSEAAHAGAAL